MKEELARKSNTINSLQMELEMVKEELYEERRLKKTVQFSPSTHERGYGSSTASETSDERDLFLSDPFDINVSEGNDYVDGEDDSESW